MEVTLYFNQRTHGGAVEWEAWQLSNIDDVDFVYGSGECLNRVRIILPSSWHVSNDHMNRPQVYDSNGWQVEFFDIDGQIYAHHSESSFAKKIEMVVDK